MIDDDFRDELFFDWRGRYISRYDRRYQDLTDSDLTRDDPIRTKQSHPYSYDPFTIWGYPGPSKKCNASDYTDRLHQWDYRKYDSIAREVYTEGARPFDSHHCRGDLIEVFLQKYHNDPTIKLLRVIEYCDASSGYPTWRLDYVTTKARQ